MDLQNQIKTSESSKENPSSSMTKPDQASVDSVPVDSKKPKKSGNIKINFKTLTNWLIFFLILTIFGYVGFNIFKVYNYQPQANVEEIKIIDDQQVLQRIEGTVEQGNSVSPSESGYGRSDPFAKY